MKKLVLFESKENVGAFSTCLGPGHGNEVCQEEIWTLLGEHAASPLRLCIISSVDIDSKNSISTI